MAVDVVLTSDVQHTIAEAIKCHHIPQDLVETLSKYATVPLVNQGSAKAEKIVPIPFKLVKQLWECLREKDYSGKNGKLTSSHRNHDSGSKMYLHELLTGSVVYVEPLKLPEKSPELVARLKRLKAEQEKAEYDRMVSNVNKKWDQSDGIQFGQEVRSGSKQLASIVNFLLSIVGTFVFGYIASQYAFPSVAMRVIIGILLAVVVAIAELYFMARVEI